MSDLYQYARLYILKKRGGGNIMQLSDIRFIDELGNYYSYASNATCSASSGNWSGSESPQKLIDNNVDTKFCNTSFSEGMYVNINFGNNPIDFYTYTRWQWFTANDLSERDPVSWRLEISKDGTEYFEADSAENVNVTQTRKTLAYTGSINLPPAPPPPPKPEGKGMKIKIGDTSYTKLKDLDFIPETDIIGNSLPINRFTVNVNTDDNISPNTLIYLMDVNENIWAYYWITDAYAVEDGWIHIIAQSTMVLLNRYTLPAKMYDGTDTFTNIIGEIFNAIQTVFPLMDIVSIDSSFANTVISGYAPEQSARDRLLWVLFCARAYVKSYFNSCAEILPVNSEEIIIPAEKTFWKPEVKANDYVTEIRVRAYTYTYTSIDPSRTDNYVKIGNDVYIQTEQDYSLRNSGLPATVSENVINIQKNTLVNENNVQGILSDLAVYYFNRWELSADILNGGDYLPGEKVVVNDGSGHLYAGFVKSARFSFGHRSKSKLDMQVATEIEAAQLIIRCLYESVLKEQFTYLMPIGYAYSIENKYLDMHEDNVRNIYRPVNEYATGTVVSGGTTDDENYELAISAEDGIVALYIVTTVSESDNIVTIG